MRQGGQNSDYTQQPLVGNDSLGGATGLHDGSQNNNINNNNKGFMNNSMASDNIRKQSSRKKSSSLHGNKIGAWQLLRMYMKDPNTRPAVFVLFVCLMTYMFNQVDRYLISILASDMQKSQNWGPSSHDGTGSQYELLAGPIFTIIYLPAGIPVAWLSDRFHNKRSLILGIALLIWSLSCVMCGFSTQYWQVAVCRFVLALAESACTPLAGSLISDYFPKDTRATALGIYNWGIYTGFSLALGAANYMTDELNSWRVVWWTFGFAGVFWVPFVWKINSNTGVRKVSRLQHSKNNQNERNNRISINGNDNDNDNISNNNNNNDSVSSIPNEENVSTWKVLAYFFGTPSIMLLFIASLIRNAGGYVWAYNATQFFENVKHQSKAEIAAFMQWIPLIGGSLGAVLGGFISDRYVANAPSWRRIVILVASNLLAAPFAWLALFLPAPYGYLCLIPSNVIGEMWVGITLALVIEICPQSLKTTSVSIYFFFIGIAGFFPFLVTYVQRLFDSYTFALMILFPGLYVLSSVLFLLTLFTIQRDKRKAELENQIVQPIPM